MPLLTKPRASGGASGGPAEDVLAFGACSGDEVTPDERARIREANIKAMVCAHAACKRRRQL